MTSLKSWIDYWRLNLIIWFNETKERIEIAYAEITQQPIPKDINQTLKEANYLYYKGQYQDNDLYNQILKKDPTNFYALLVNNIPKANLPILYTKREDLRKDLLKRGYTLRETEDLLSFSQSLQNNNLSIEVTLLSLTWRKSNILEICWKIEWKVKV